MFKWKNALLCTTGFLEKFKEPIIYTSYVLLWSTNLLRGFSPSNHWFSTKLIRNPHFCQIMKRSTPPNVHQKKSELLDVSIFPTRNNTSSHHPESHLLLSLLRSSSLTSFPNQPLNPKVSPHALDLDQSIVETCASLGFLWHLSYQKKNGPLTFTTNLKVIFLTKETLL